MVIEPLEPNAWRVRLDGTALAHGVGVANVVVVDPDRADGEAIALVLCLCGFSVVTYRDATTACSRLLDAPATVAVVVQRQQGDAAHLRRTLGESGCATPIVVVAQAPLGPSEGRFAGVLPAPLQPEELVTAVRGACAAATAVRPSSRSALGRTWPPRSAT